MLREACWMLAVIVGGERLAASQNPEQPMTADELFSEPDAMVDGANVQLDYAVVRAKAGNVLRVRVDHHEIFVVPDDPSLLEWITVGARVNVSGILRPTPAAKQAQLIYAMGRAEARRLARTKFYVEASSVSAVD